MTTPVVQATLVISSLVIITGIAGYLDDQHPVCSKLLLVAAIVSGITSALMWGQVCQ